MRGAGNLLTAAVVVVLVSSLVVGKAGEETPRQDKKVEPREKRQTEVIPSGICDFGSEGASTWCSWSSPGPDASSRVESEGAPEAWTLSTGMNSLWVGGPFNDTTGDDRGGYAFHETSSTPSKLAPLAVMESEMQGPTGPDGKCLKFWYFLDGLSASELRVKVRKRGEGKAVTIWKTNDLTRGDWREAQALYTFTDNHTIMVEAVPATAGDPFNIFRGHIAVDDLGTRPGQECIGLCSFEGGMCDWNNVRTDDFDWVLGRGTQNPITGPPRDHSSSQGEALGGAYVFLDSSFPRRPGDVGRLESIEFQATDPNNPPCMRFYTYMAGRGVGRLRVLLEDVVTRKQQIMWALQGHQGTRWVQGQLPLSSGTPFKVVFEGTIGKPRLGDIALDDITIVSGPCASDSSPAAMPPASGDCTFEEDTCGWSNPGANQRVDNLQFLRVRAAEFAFPTTDHSTGSRQGFYMKLESPARKQEGDHAWLLSPIMQGDGQAKCLSFWYLMFEPLGDVEPNLGSLSAFMLREGSSGALILTPVWTLHNFQGLTWFFAQTPLRAEGDFQVVIEAVWGASNSSGMLAIDDISVFDGNCRTVPEAAVVRAGDCTFTRGSCGWTNLTSDRDFTWTLSSAVRRPLNMHDHTYGAPAGYIYFDVFNLGGRTQRLQLVSPVVEPMPDRSPLCFTFWFAGFGADPNTSLSIYLRPSQLRSFPEQLLTDLSSDIRVWSHILGDPVGWLFGQVQLLASTRFQVVFEGVSFNGGFTLDDFKVYAGTCSKRPRDSSPSFSRS
ncbi:MAM and LDL-receptor class A domain-containing protein 1-like [Portunus trituberculatus]|uniref:MAM and LDL-receptor class A domain-containing protein 1-like n=1 Tax=Portunus trituberculatus TaxID=210409 RepID=UPI001E1CD0AA|nr:MAM and LDL-receptor class A domain-containing protein 1-like [Portunus trituberculatus]